MAVTCTVTVANLYFGQPLLHSIGSVLHVSQTAASLLVTAGFAGIIAAVGLGRRVGDRGRFLTPRPSRVAVLARGR